MSSVGEDIPPDRGRNSLEIEIDEVACMCKVPDKLPTKRRIGDIINPQNKIPASIPIFSSSNQHTYTVPGYDLNSNITYSENDLGPYIVIVTRTENDELSSSNNMRALKMAQIIYNNKIQGVDEIKKIGRNKVSVIFKNCNDANSFACSSILSSHNLTAHIPRYQVTRMGVIRQIPIEWTLEELVQSTDCRSDSPRVVKARRLNKKKRLEGNTVWEPTGTVVLTFLGQILPKHIYCFNMSVPVETYTLPTIQCHKCCWFGHVRDQCRSAPRCSRCAGPHDANICETPVENASCLYCSGKHMAIDPNCPEYSRQKAIKIDMSRDNISYTEAAARYPRVRKSFADIVNSSLPKKPIYLSRPSSVHVSSPNPIQSSFESQHPNVSYRKTVYVQRKLKPTPSKSYDHLAHNNITCTPSSSLPNGCALREQSSNNPTPNDNLAELLSLALVNIFSRFGELIPNNVLLTLQSLTSSLINPNPNNGQQSDPMELSEH